MKETKEQLAKCLIQEVKDGVRLKRYEEALQEIYSKTSCQIAQSIALEALGDRAPD